MASSGNLAAHEQLGRWWKSQKRFRTQREFARWLGVDPMSVSCWLRGRYLPRGPNRQRIRELIGVDLGSAGWVPGRKWRKKQSLRMTGSTFPSRWKKPGEETSVSDALLAEMRLSGKTVQEMADGLPVRRNYRSVSERLQRIGFPASRHPCFFSRGEPITETFIHRLSSDAGLSYRELAAWEGVKCIRVERRRPGNLEWRRADRFVTLRRSWEQGPLRQRVGRVAESRLFLRSEIEELPGKYNNLVHVLTELKSRFPARPGDPGLVLNWICERASRERGLERVGLRTQPQAFRMFLYWWPQFLELLNREKNSWKLRPWELAHKFLASEYGVGRETVRRVINVRMEAADPRLVRALVFSTLQKKRRKARGAPSGLRPKTSLRIDIAAAAKVMGKQAKEISDEMHCPGRRCYEFVSEYRPQIDARAKEISREQAPGFFKAAADSLARLLKKS